MTDYWVSTKKHYCETCKCWLSAHKLNIKNHERSTRHLENFRKLLNQSSARREQEAKEQEFLEKELQKLEKVEKKYLASLNKNVKPKNNNNNNNNTIHNNNNTIHDNNNTIHDNNNTIHNNGDNNNIENKNTAANTSYNYLRNVSHIPSTCNLSEQGDTQKEPKQNETKSEYTNWLIMIDANTGRLVYLNKENGEIKQELPEIFSGEIHKEEAFTEQNGWYKHLDSYTNCNYYYNINTAQFIWEYSSHNINRFIAYVKQWENANVGNYLANSAMNSVDSNNSYANYWQPNHSTMNSYVPNENAPENYTSQFHGWYLQGFDTEKRENQKKTKIENNETEKAYVSLNLSKQKNHGGTEQQRTNQTNAECLENNLLIRENKKNKTESAQKKDEEKEKNISTVRDGSGSPNDANSTKDVSVEKKNDQAPVKKKRISRWDQRPVKTEEEQVKEIMEKVEDKEKNERGKQTKQTEEEKIRENEVAYTKEEIKETEEDMPKKKMKMNLNTEKLKEGKFIEPSKQVQNKKDNNAGIPGTWEVVKNPEVQTIPIDNVEDIFYNIKSRDHLEQEELLNLEEHIKEEYSQFDKFYVKKKELENPDLFLNQEFQFVNKPVFIKATDKKNSQKEKVTFVKRNIKAKNKKGDISNAN